MVSPQQHKLDEVGTTSESGSWNSRTLLTPIIPQILCNHQNLNKNASIKNPNKRTYEEIKFDCHQDEEDDNNNSTNSNSNNINNTSTNNDHLHVSVRKEELNVIPAEEWHENASEDYKMSSRVRGYCLIINNVNFQNEIFHSREGSDKDAFRLRKIFEQLGFEVDCKRNQSSEKMLNAFKQKAALCMGKHDALVVVLLSHGSEHGIYGVDGIEVNYNDVLSYFDNKRCRTMRGKPKVFIVQACRGHSLDYGVPNATQTFFSQPESQSNAQPSQLTQINTQSVRLCSWSARDHDFNPTRTDMILCFSSQLGYVSTRNKDEGSWLCSSLAARLCEEAHKRHFMDILNMVSRDIKLCRSESGLKQVLEVTSIGFDKNLYLNPGLFR